MTLCECLCLCVVSLSLSPNSMLFTQTNGLLHKMMYAWKEQALDDMDSTLDLQQYIQQSIRCNTHDVQKIIALPEGRDRNAWIYEHMR